jgi:aquaporin Z
LWGIHLVGIQVTGVSVNPARSFGPALFTGLGQLWLFIVAPALGAVLAGLAFRAGILERRDTDQS